MLLLGMVQEQQLGCGLLSVQMLCTCVRRHTHEARIKMQNLTSSYATI